MNYSSKLFQISSEFAKLPTTSIRMSASDQKKNKYLETKLENEDPSPETRFKAINLALNKPCTRAVQQIFGQNLFLLPISGA